MAKKEYEISIWRDIWDTDHFIEKKVAIIGSNTMDSPSRAFEPQLVENINGTRTFTFKMYYRYTDPMVIESYHADDMDTDTFINPFIQHLANETKIKVKWNGEWYDFIIKDCQEDSSNKCITYTCTDLFISELSKNGFNLTFSDDTKNSIGTIKELTEQVLEGTDWKFLPSKDTIQQTIDSPVYEVEVLTDIKVNNDSNGGTIEIPKKEMILVYYSCVDNSEPFCQFIYDKDQKYEREDENSQLVVGGIQCSIDHCTWVTDKNQNKSMCVSSNGAIQAIFNVNVASGVSLNYRGKRLVRTQRTIWDPLTEKWAYIYTANRTPTKEPYRSLFKKDEHIYGIIDTEVHSSDLVSNLIINSSNFSDNSGWITENNDPIVIELSKGIDSVPEEIQQAYDNKEWINAWVDDSEFQIYMHLPKGKVRNTGIRYAQLALPNGIAQGNQFVLRYKAVKKSAGTWKPFDTTQKIELSIDGAVLNRKGSYEYNKDTGWVQVIFEAGKSISRERMSDLFFEFTIPSTNMWFEEIQLFRLVKDGNDKIIYPDAPFTSSDDFISVKQYYKYYNADRKWPSSEEIQYIASSETDWYTEGYIDPVYNTNFEAVRTIRETESNRFNLLQTIAETFECWCRFKIEHNEDTGEIVLDDITKRQKKYVTFEKEIGDETGIGFIYGIDLQSISRTIQSDQLVTKTIVKENSNEFAQNGFCTIQRARDNYSKDSFILNFDYYISQGFLKADEVNDSLYNSKTGYYTNLRKLNTEYDSLYEDRLNTKNLLFTAETQLSVLEKELLAYQQQGKNLMHDLMVKTGSTTVNGAVHNSDLIFIDKKEFEINEVLNHTSEITTEKRIVFDKGYLTCSRLSSSIQGVSSSSGQLLHGEEVIITWNGLNRQLTYTFAPKDDKTPITVMVDGKLQYPPFEISNANNREVYVYGISRVTIKLSAVISTTNVSEEYSADIFALCANFRSCQETQLKYNSTKEDITKLKSKIAILDDKIEANIKSREELQTKFFRQYSRYIQEGSWIDESYIDDNLYYIDAQSVAYTSSRPQVSYNISVLRLEGIDEFTNKKFHVGDIAYIQDTEFFGYVYKVPKEGAEPVKTPYKEKVLISEITSNFDEPDQDSIKVQNYKTQFEDLFQRITAATQQLKFAEGSYARAANGFNTDGTISAGALQGTLDNAENLTITYGDHIKQDNQGIYLIDPQYNNRHMRVYGSGISISMDGGKTWGTALDANGINTAYLQAGNIDTSSISLYDGNNVSFRWDSSGINAYYPKIGDGLQFSKFVRFDRYGIYGIDLGNDHEEYLPKNEQQIWKDGKFGMTWQGFFLKNKDGDGWVEISSTEDIRLMDSREKERIKIGRIVKVNGGYRYGMRLRDASGNISLETDDQGLLYLKSGLFITDQSDTKNTKYRVALGYLKNASDYYKDYNGIGQIFNANNNFIVYENGRIEAKEGSFTGDVWAENGSFSGHVEAKTGSIGGWVIGEEERSGLLIPNIHSKQKINGKPVTTLYGNSGLIDTQRINIGREARIVDFIKLGGTEGYERIYEPDASYIFNPNNYDDIYGIRKGLRGNMFIKTGAISLTSEGKLWLGENTESQILIDGTQSIIQGGGAMENGDGGLLNFKITPNWSIFKNIEVWGKIVTAVFEANHVQAVGGAMVFKPSHKVASYTNKTLTLEEDFIGSVGDFIILIDKEGTQLSAANSELHNQTNYEELSSESIDNDIFQVTAISGSTISIYPDYRGNTEVDMIVNFGEDGSMIIGANSNWGGKDYLRSRGITLSEFNMISDGQFQVLKENAKPNGTGEYDDSAYETLYIWSPELEQDGLIFDVNDERPKTKHKEITMEFVKGREWGRDPKAFLGDMDSADIAFNDAIPKGYGLYSNNVYLNGSLTTRITDETGPQKSQSYAGVSTTSSAYALERIFEPLRSYLGEPKVDNSRIVFFAGAGDTSAASIQQAPFQVTADGSLYARRGLFQNGIMTHGKIIGSDIYAARIHGNNDSYLNDNQLYGLSFYNTANGIAFFNDEFNINSFQCSPIFSIGKNGFKLDDINYFIKVEDQKVNIMANDIKVEDEDSFLIIKSNKIYNVAKDNINQNGNMEIVFGTEQIQIGCSDSYNTSFTKEQVEFDTRQVKINNNVVLGDTMQYVKVNNGYNLYIY